ncbi:hypothetical protein D3C80_1087910 [compost metagenome]
MDDTATSINSNDLCISELLNSASEAQDGRYAMRAGDDRNMRCGAAMSADDAFDFLKRSPSQIPSTNVVGDKYGPCGQTFQIDVFFAKKGEANLAADGMHIVCARIEIRVVKCRKLPGNCGCCSQHC